MESHVDEFVSQGSSPPDILIRDHGSIVLLYPLTVPAWEWCEQHVSREGFQPYWPIVVAEPRYVQAIVEGAIADGLEVA